MNAPSFSNRSDRQSRAPRQSELTLLVVDDDAAWREELRKWLEDERFRTIMLARADWIAHAIELHKPDVVVLDVNLPGVSGLEVLESLSRRWPSLPVIIMTAFGGPGVGDRAERFGAFAYLEKPFRMTTLVEKIRSAASSGHDPSTPPNP